MSGTYSNSFLQDTAETQNNALLAPDLSLIHGYGHPEEDNRPELPVGITRFQKGNKILDFVTVEHTGNLQDPTHQTVKEAIETPSPQTQMVITEGHATDMDPYERKMIIKWTKEEVEKVQKNNNIQDPNTYIPEAGYAAYVAAEHHIPSIGGETSGNDFLTRMQSHGYSSEDVLADTFIRQIETIPPEKRLSMTEEEFITNHAKELLAKTHQKVDPSHTAAIEPLTIDKFKQWYTGHPLSENRSFPGVNHKDFEPHQTGDYLQKMACASGVVRDEHIATLIADYLKQYDKVTIVYGADHLNSLRLLFEDKEKGMFGTPGTILV